jgi:hypothetical protein
MGIGVLFYHISTDGWSTRDREGVFTWLSFYFLHATELPASISSSSSYFSFFFCKSNQIDTARACIAVGRGRGRGDCTYRRVTGVERERKEFMLSK